jgi:hypothetical protein
MTFKNQLDAIINSNTTLDKSLLIINFLEDQGLSLYGNGWLDNDTKTMIDAESDEVYSEREKIISAIR